MDKELFEQLKQSMRQHSEIDAGTRKPSRVFDFGSVQKIRAHTGLSQQKFADVLLVPVGTLRNWEQGLRSPTGPAKALLRAIEHDPKNVLNALIRAKSASAVRAPARHRPRIEDRAARKPGAASRRAEAGRPTIGGSRKISGRRAGAGAGKRT